MSPRARRWFSVFLTAALAAGPWCVPAASQTLYGAAAPPGAAYVRLFRAVDGSPGRPLILGPARFGAVGHGAVTAYRPVPPDIYQLRSDGHAAEIIPRAGRWYTVAVTRQGVRVFEDPVHADPARAQLVLYNLSALLAVGLSTQDGRTPVIAPIAPGTAARVTVNAVPAALGVFAEAAVLREVGDPGLRRGSSYSAFVFEDGGQTAVLWAEAVLAPE